MKNRLNKIDKIASEKGISQQTPPEFRESLGTITKTYIQLN
jgi:hypothetical protein